MARPRPQPPAALGFAPSPTRPHSRKRKMSQNKDRSVLDDSWWTGSEQQSSLNDSKPDVNPSEEGLERQAPTVGGLTILTASVFVIGEMAGSGVLALPAAVSGAGWSGIALLVLGCIASGYCGAILGITWATLRERHVEYQGHVRYPYPAIGEKAYGKWASRAVTICITVTLLGVCIVFLILAAQNLASLISFHIPHPAIAKEDLRIWLLICFSCLLPCSWLGTPKEFWGIAVGASVATAIACLLICVCIGLDMPSDLGKVEKAPITFESLSSAFGTILFAFGGASTFPTIQTDMKKASDFPNAVGWSYLGVISMYLPVSVLGFVAFGKDIESNILESIKHDSAKPHTVILDIVLALITAHLLFSFIIVINPVSQQFEAFFKLPQRFTWQRCLLRSLIMCFILGVAELIPNFGPILSLIGGSTVTALTFVFPCLFYLKIKGNLPLHVKALLLELIAIGVVGGIASTYSAVNAIRETFMK